MDSERSERIRYFGFAGFLLLLNLIGYFKTIFGIDTAAIITVPAGYRIFFNSIAALAVGQYLAAAEAMFILLAGEGLEACAAGRTSAAIHRFVEQIPRRVRLLRDGEELEVDAGSLMRGDVNLVCAGERIPADGRFRA
jgi:cation transport ATPase